MSVDTCMSMVRGVSCGSDKLRRILSLVGTVKSRLATTACTAKSERFGMGRKIEARIRITLPDLCSMSMTCGLSDVSWLDCTNCANGFSTHWSSEYPKWVRMDGVHVWFTLASDRVQVSMGLGSFGAIGEVVEGHNDR